MSLGIAFKGPEGIVLAADSRVTLGAAITQPGQPVSTVAATFDNATKLLRVAGQDYVGAVTFGAGAIGITEPRTAHSFLPELERELADEPRLTVEAFAHRLNDFYGERWKSAGMAEGQQPMVFLVGGYDPDAPYGRLFVVNVPVDDEPKEVHAGAFGALWGGQREFADRIMQGFDEGVVQVLKHDLELDDVTIGHIRTNLRSAVSIRVPYAFLPLQDCVDLSVALIRLTISFQQWTVGVRGVGGPIDVATITRTGGFEYVQSKTIKAER
jgi:hypothetical protein